jgi:hypothetical protein
MSDMYGILAGIAYAILVATVVVLMLEASGPSRSAATRSRLIALHRAKRKIPASPSGILQTTAAAQTLSCSWWNLGG